MNTKTLLSPASQSNTNTAQGRILYHRVQVAGLVSPLVDALSRAGNLDAIWAVPFAFEEMAHPLRPTLTLSVVIQRAGRDGANQHMRVDSLQSARSALLQAGHYSEWTQRSYAPLVELVDLAIAKQRSKRAL